VFLITVLKPDEYLKYRISIFTGTTIYIIKVSDDFNDIAELPMIFFAKRGFNAPVDVHGLRGNKGDGFRDVFFLQAPGKNERMGFFTLTAMSQ
jgi:hypothetical protein